MKELSIEEKAKRYDEAIEKLRSLHNDYDTVSTLIDFKEELENIFPELKESEDERIRKKLYESIRINNSREVADKYIAWLEKQGKHKSAWRKEDNAMFNFIALILRNHQSDEDFTTFETTFKDCIDWFKNLKDRVQPQPKQEWSEEDETALGDALWCCRQAASIAKDENDMGNLWCAERWLKSLKGRVQPQPMQEWSEEDCNQIETIACHLDNIGNGAMAESLLNIMDKYKSLRPQSQWKPSDEQMEALQEAIIEMGKSVSPCSIEEFHEIQSLYFNLKKLTE